MPFTWVALVAMSLLIAGGCASHRLASPIERSAPPPAYQLIAQRYNQRIEPLVALWARAVIRLEYVDEEGDLKREQGEGHLQLLKPDRFALSVGKLGETFAWLGCDASRYWFFELHDVDRVSVGLHKNLGSACNRDAGLPAHPLDIIELLAVTKLPADERGSTSWSSDGRSVVVDAPARLGRKRLFLDPDSLEPSRVELRGAQGETTLIGELSMYEPVLVRSMGGHRPRAASEVIITSPQSSTKIRLHLAAMSDGSDRRGRLAPEAFDFDSLVDALGPRRLVVLDEACPQSAVAISGDGGH